MLFRSQFFFVKVLPPLGIEPATSNAEGIEGTIGLLGCSRCDCNAEHEAMTTFHNRSKTDPCEWTCLCTDWSNPHFMPHLARQPKGWISKKTEVSCVWDCQH